MFSIEPIKKIKGLFSSYKNEQVVPAEEYNANIECLQQAIEHNGCLLDEHSKAFEKITTDKLPEGAVHTDLIADEAITLPKLSPDIRDQMLLTPDIVSGYFQDFITQCHKSSPDVRGVFMNGAIQTVNQTLARQTTYTKTVTHGTDGYVLIGNYDCLESDWVKIPFTNEANPATYEINTDSTGKSLKGCHFTWHTHYVLDQPYNINTATDLFTAHWDYMLEQYRADHSSGEGSCTVRFKDADGVVQAQFSNNLAKKPGAWDNTYATSRHDTRTVVGVDISQTTAQVLENICVIEIETSYTDVVKGRIYDGRPNGRLDLPKDRAPTLSVNMRFGAGTTERAQYETTLPAVNNANYAVIGAYVKGITEVDLNTYKLNLAPHCVGTCPYQPAPGFEEQIVSYIDETEDSIYSTTLTDASANRYYVKHNFQAPLIISAKIKTNKPDRLHPDFIAGEYYSWPLHFATKTYITYSTLNDTIQALKEHFADYIEDITCTEYSLGGTQLGLQFNTTLNNLTVESVSVAKYPGFAKPSLT